MKPSSQPSLFVALFVVFVDYMGIGLIYPLFSTMLFDTSLTLLPPSTSNEMRGFILGVLLALMPFAQFFSSPIWGALSDAKGRKPPLIWSLLLVLLGYLVSTAGVVFSSIVTLLISRLILGFAAGNTSIVQATIVDISSPQEKSKNFGLYSMALGLGFTLGPFFGGFLGGYGYDLPFVFASLVIALNLLVGAFFFKETHHLRFTRKLSWTMGLVQLKKAFLVKGIRSVLLASFLHYFGWSYFFEFIPVYLITSLNFTSQGLGVFYGVMGGLYAICSGYLIRPFLKLFLPESLYFIGNLVTGLCIMSIVILPSIIWFWPIAIIMSFFASFVTPNSTTLVSNSASKEIQGEALGILTSVNAAAMVLSPLLAGPIVGVHPLFSTVLGGLCMVIAASVILGVFRSRLFKLP